MTVQKQISRFLLGWSRNEANFEIEQSMIGAFSDTKRRGILNHDVNETTQVRAIKEKKAAILTGQFARCAIGVCAAGAVALFLPATAAFVLAAIPVCALIRTAANTLSCHKEAPLFRRPSLNL